MWSVRKHYVRWRRGAIYRRCLRPPSRVVALRYHSVAEDEDARTYIDPGLSVSPRRFREQLRILRRSFELIAPRDIEGALSESRRRPAMVITFDDGYRDNYDFAVPVLLDEGLAAAFFIATRPLAARRGLWTSELWRLGSRLPVGPLGLERSGVTHLPALGPQRRRSIRVLTRWLSSLPEDEREAALDLLSRRAGVPRGDGLEDSFVTIDQLRQMHDAGMTIGAHTRSHPHLDRLDSRYHADETGPSRRDLEELLQQRVTWFAYPNPGGRAPASAAARASVTAAGFTHAFTSQPGGIGLETDRLMLPRVGVFGGEQQEVLFDLIANSGAHA